MLIKEVVKDYAHRKCDRLAYLQLEEKRLLSFWRSLVENKREVEDFLPQDDDWGQEGEKNLLPFDYFRTYPEALKEALKIYQESLTDDIVGQFIAENEDFQEVSELSRRYFALKAKNPKRADTFDGALDSPELENQAKIEANTQKYLNDPTVDVIFEGQISIEGLRARFDVLVRDEESFSLYEVKGSNRVMTTDTNRIIRQNYLYDLAFQYAVYRRAKLPLKSLGFVHLNKDFKLKEEAYPLEDSDLENFFTITDTIMVDGGPCSLKDYYDKVSYVTAENKDVEVYINHLQSLMKRSDIPQAHCLYRCRRKGLCPLIKACFPSLGKEDVFLLTCNGAVGGYWGSLKQLIDVEGIEKIKDIPFGLLEDKYPKVKAKTPYKRSVARLQIDYARGEFSKDHHLEIKALKNLLEQDYQQFPLIFFDFESFSYPVPLVRDMKPWQQICCQYSMHIVQENYELAKHDFQKGIGGGISHYEFIGNPKKDGFNNPSLALIKSLLEQLKEADIKWQDKRFQVVVYNEVFEKSRLKEMSAQYPEYSEFLDTFSERVVDLYKFFSYGLWYHKDFHGFTSLKVTQPTLVKDQQIKNWYQSLNYNLSETLDYKKELIQNGEEALDVYKTLLRLVHRHGDLTLHDKLLASLRQYCKIDSWGTVVLYDIIRRAVTKIDSQTLDIEAIVDDLLLK